MSQYPISRVCPSCGSTEYRQKRSEEIVAFASDRICQSCQTRYTPPTPLWAGAAFILIGLVLVGAAGYSFFILVSVPALIIQVILCVIGVAAILLGIRALVRPGKV